MSVEKQDTKKTVRRTYARDGSIRKLLRHLVWLTGEHGAEIVSLKWYTGGAAASGKRKAHPDDSKGPAPKKRAGRPRKNTGKLTREEHKKKIAREASKRYRDRQKQKQETKGK